MISYTGTKIESFRQAAKDGEWTEKEKEEITEIFLDSTNEEIENLCPDCKVYCIKRFIDGRCE